jgi:hypothetical protein
VLWAGCFVEMTNFRKVFKLLLFKFLFFTLLLAKSNFHASAFAFSILSATLFKFLLFTLLLAKSNFHASAFHAFNFKRNAFQVSAGKIQLSRFCFVSFYRNKRLFFRLFSSA